MYSKFPKRLFIAILFIISGSVAFSQIRTDAFHYSSQKKVECMHGAVVSAHALASKVGIDILKKGGNAVDAAIATQLAYTFRHGFWLHSILIAKLLCSKYASQNYAIRQSQCNG